MAGSSRLPKTLLGGGKASALAWGGKTSALALGGKASALALGYPDTEPGLGVMAGGEGGLSACDPASPPVPPNSKLSFVPP